jgi:hypothetical protein
MKKISIQKFSIVGLFLSATAATAALVLPENRNSDSVGKLNASTGGTGNQFSCVPTINAVECNVTDDTFTSEGAGTSFPNIGSSEMGVNTSNSPS